jgi:hypothetical protein
MCQGKTGQIPNKFEKLVKLSGVNLTQYIYPMINYLQVRECVSTDWACRLLSSYSVAMV